MFFKHFFLEMFHVDKETMNDDGNEIFISAIVLQIFIFGRFNHNYIFS